VERVDTSNEQLITSLSEFLSRVAESGTDNTLYRGQPSNWSLCPSIGRNTDNNPDDEKYIFKYFKRLGASLTESRLNTNWDWLSVAQHRGLPTRMLDWTSNPLAALWFAVSGPIPENGDPVVWAIDPSEDSYVDTEKAQSDPFEIDCVRIYKPRSIDARIHAQTSCFSVHPWSNEHKNRMVHIPPDNSGEKKSPGYVTMHVIRKEAAEEISAVLNKCGLHGFNLFPDLDGLARHLAGDLKVKRKSR